MKRMRLRSRGWAIAALGIMLGACGGEEEQTPDATGNHAPSIEGAPAPAADEDVAYAFSPSATDSDGDALVFGIEGKPSWATFDTATGELAGTPTASNVGMHKGIIVWVSDGKKQTVLPPFDVEVRRKIPGANRAPIISGAPATTALVGTQYSFTPTASDADRQPLTFSIRNRPTWAAFDATTGRLQGVPVAANVGTVADVTISVSDGAIAVALPAFSIAVTPPPANRAPVISGTPMTSVEAGAAYTFVPTASDADGNVLTFSVAGRPSWAIFDTTTGRLSGTPPADTTGTASGIVISVNDGTATASLPTFAITVRAPTGNRAPTISGAPQTTATQGQPYTFTPTANDADGNALTFAIANRPTWATFNITTGTLQGTPGATHVGTFGNIVISVSDGNASTPLSAFSITVASSNTPPTISGAPPATATVGTLYSFAPTANDANGGTLTFSISNRPGWATFNAGTGRLQGTPTTANVGTFADIRISVSDGQDSTQLAPFSIVVSGAANRAPTITGVPNISITQGAQYVFAPAASDPDGDTLTFSIANRPAWASFDTATGRLSGMPSAQHVGATTGILISVSDGQASTSLAAFSVTVLAVATGSATLSWNPPTTNTDGSPLTNLAGYKIYWGTTAGTYPNSATLTNPGLTSYVVTNLVPGTYFFVATAVNSLGAESVFSAPASTTIP